MAGTAERTLALKLIADVNGLKKVQPATRQFGKLTKSVISWGKALSGALVIGGIEKVVAGLGDAYAGFKSGERVTKQLRTTWRNLGMEGSKFQRTLDRITDSTLKLGESDDEAVQVFNDSIKRTRDAGESLRRLTIAQDLAASKGISLQAAMKLVDQAATGSARAVDQFGLKGKTAGARVSELGRLVKGAAREAAQANPLKGLFNRLAEDAETIVGAFSKGDFSGVVEGLKGLGHDVEVALFGKFDKFHKKKVPGALSGLADWGKKMGDGIAEGLVKTDWAKALSNALNAGIVILQTVSKGEVWSPLAAIGLTIAGAIFAADVFLTAVRTLFKAPMWLVEGAVSKAAAGAMIAARGAMTVALFTGEKAIAAFSVAATTLFGTLKTAAADVGKGIGLAARGLGFGIAGAIAGGIVAGLLLLDPIQDWLNQTFPPGQNPGTQNDAFWKKRYNAVTGRKAEDDMAAYEEWLKKERGFAKGGIVKARPGGSLILAGEGGRDEAVVPLGRGRQMAVAGAGSITVNVYGYVGSEAELGRHIGRALEQYKKRGGRGWY